MLNPENNQRGKLNLLMMSSIIREAQPKEWNVRKCNNSVWVLFWLSKNVANTDVHDYVGNEGDVCCFQKDEGDILMSPETRGESLILRKDGEDGNIIDVTSNKTHLEQDQVHFDVTP